MTEPTNADLMTEVTALRRQIDRIVRNIPLLAQVAGDSDLKRREVEKSQRRKADARRMARGGR